MATTSKKTYYWAGGLPLAPGSIVMPGNWYRIVSQTPGHHCALREEIAEQVRLELYPELPSRKEGLFICDSLELLNTFLINNPRPLDIIYEVEVVDATQKQCTVDSDLTTLQNMHEGGRPLSTHEHIEQAKRYWASSEIKEGIQRPEIITESPIKIVRRVNT